VPPLVQKLSSPAKRRQASAVSGGGLGSGLLVLVVGLVLHGHFSPIKHGCESGLGVLSQAVEPKSQQHCWLDSVLADVGTVATIIGAIILAGALLMLIGLFGLWLEARQELKA
jgi:hypothetical protein